MAAGTMRTSRPMPTKSLKVSFDSNGNVTCLKGFFHVWVQHHDADEPPVNLSLLVTKTLPNSFAPPNVLVTEIPDSISFESVPVNTQL